MWLPLLLACSGPPPPAAPPAAAAWDAPWSALALPAEGVLVVHQRPDSLVVRGPDEALPLAAWTAALAGQGWQVDAASQGRGGLHAVRYVRGEGPDEALVFSATRYEGRATHALTLVEVP